MKKFIYTLVSVLTLAIQLHAVWQKKHSVANLFSECYINSEQGNIQRA